MGGGGGKKLDNFTEGGERESITKYDVIYIFYHLDNGSEWKRI